MNIDRNKLLDFLNGLLRPEDAVTPGSLAEAHNELVERVIDRVRDGSLDIETQPQKVDAKSGHQEGNPNDLRSDDPKE